jgi:4-amino-4-deoxy-L-arabinose transferase-like glycosyltransferase
LEAPETDSIPAPSAPGSRELETRWSLWWLLLIVAAGCLVYLAAAPSPWSKGLDTSPEAKESLRTHSWVVMGLWYGAAINLGLSILALLVWHFRPEMVEGSALTSDEPPPADRAGQWFRGALVLIATVTAAWAMLPRLDLSLWGDEEATTRRFIVGHVYRSDEGGFTVKAPTWIKSIWNWDTGTNSHLLFNVLARLSHGAADDSGKDPDQFYFSERRIRLPSFLATLLLIPAAAALVTRLGFPRGAPLTAFLLALHPWVIRFGSDARGYALLMLFAVVTMVFLIQALQRPGRVGWWLAFGICECLALLSNLSAVFLLVPLNLVALWLAWAPTQPGRLNPLRVATVWRYAGATLLGAMLTIQILMPIILQAPGYFAKGRFSGGGVEPGLVRDSLAYWALGTPWESFEAGNPLALDWNALHEAHPLATVWAAALIGLFLVAGFLALFWRSAYRWWLVPLLAPVPLIFLEAHLSENILYPWYTVAFLPLGLVVVGVGFGAVAPGARRWPKALGAIPPLLAGFGVLALFAVATQAQRQIIRTHAVEPLAETVRLTRDVVNPFHPDIDDSLTLGYVHASRLYDPAMKLAENDEEFIAAIREAEMLKRPLWVNAANLGLAKSIFPKASALVEDRDVFEAPIVVHGLQQPCTRYVFRYKPGGLMRFEAKGYRNP